MAFSSTGQVVTNTSASGSAPNAGQAGFNPDGSVKTPAAAPGANTTSANFDSINNQAGYNTALSSGVTTSADVYNTSLDSQVGAIDKQIQELTASGTNPTQLAALQQQRNTLNTQRWQSLTQDSGAGATALSQAINSGQLTWAQVGANIDISAVHNDAQLLSQVSSLVQSLHPASSPTASTTSGPTAAQIATDSTAAVNQTVADLSNSAAIGSYITANGGASVQAADQTQQQNLAGIASVGTALASSEGGANAARGVGAAAGAAQQQYATTRQNLITTNSTAVENYIASTFSNDLTNNAALANMSTQDRLNIQGAAADALVTSIQKSIGTGDAAAQSSLNQLQQAINAWQTAEAGSQEQTAMWAKIGTIAAGVVMTAAGAVATAYGGGAIGAPLAAAGVGEIAKGAQE